MKKNLRLLSMMILLLTGCVATAPVSNNGDSDSLNKVKSDSAKQFAIDSVNKEHKATLDSAAQRDSAMSAKTSETFIKIDSLTSVKLVVLPKSRFLAIYPNETELKRIADSIPKRFPQEVATYSTNYRKIERIYPDRDTSTYRIFGSNLQLTNTDNFWKLERYCIIVVEN